LHAQFVHYSAYVSGVFVSYFGWVHCALVQVRGHRYEGVCGSWSTFPITDMVVKHVSVITCFVRLLSSLLRVEVARLVDRKVVLMVEVQRAMHFRLIEWTPR
jgi:hypothetical protein